MPESAPQATSVQALFVKHAATLRGFVVALLGDFGSVDDVLHETFLTVSAKAGEFTPGSNFVAWAKTIARFKVLEARRENWREVPGFSEEALEALCVSEPEEDTSSLEQRLAALSRCIDSLPPQTRRAIDLRYRQAHPAEETARILGWTTSSLYVMLCRARTALRTCVEGKLAEAR